MLDSTLANRLELWGWEEDVMVFSDFSLGSGFQLTGIDISCQTDEFINDLKSKLRQFLNGLDAGISIQFAQTIAPENKERLTAHTELSVSSAPELVSQMTQSRTARLQALVDTGGLPRTNLNLFIRKPFTRELKRKWISFGRKTELTEPILESELATFKRTVEKVQSSLSAVGVKVTRLHDQDVFGLIHDQWNPDRPVDAGELSSHDVRDQVCLTDVVIGHDHFVIGNVFHKVISLKTLPEEQTFSGMMDTLRSLPFESRLFVAIDVLDQNKEISNLQLQRRMAYASAAGKRGVSDLDAQAKLQDIESILEEMIQGVEKIFKISLNIVVKSRSEEDLETQVSEVLQALRELNGAEGMLETEPAFDIFSEISIPNARSRERAIKVNTSVAADFIPIYGSWRGHDESNVLLRSGEGSLFTFNPFSKELTNFNMIVSGGSGAGKSFFANSLLAQMLKENPKVFILDVGASYRRICENLDGQYVELGLKSNMAINPFSMDGMESDPEALDQKIKFLVTLTELMTKEPGRPGLGRLERAEIERIVQEILSGQSAPRLTHLQQALLIHSEPEMKRIGRILGSWCGDSPYGKFVDRPTTVHLEKNIVCFDLKGLESHRDLQSVCLFLVTDLIWREAQRDRTTMKFTVFDECWKILQDEAAAQFVGEVYRTFRKYRASAIAISQTMDDFAKSRVAAAIMPNASVKWVLKQKGADRESLKNALQLNEREMDLISELKSKKGEFSESFLMAEDKRQVVRTETTPLEYWLFTSDSADIGVLNTMKSKNPNLSDIEILNLCAESYPQGASGGKS